MLSTVSSHPTTQPGGAGDSKQRPLLRRSRCSPRLTPSVGPQNDKGQAF
jgi:hypothetical protein